MALLHDGLAGPPTHSLNTSPDPPGPKCCSPPSSHCPLTLPSHTALSHCPLTALALAFAALAPPRTALSRCPLALPSRTAPLTMCCVCWVGPQSVPLGREVTATLMDDTAVGQYNSYGRQPAAVRHCLSPRVSRRVFPEDNAGFLATLQAGAASPAMQRDRARAAAAGSSQSGSNSATGHSQSQSSIGAPPAAAAAPTIRMPVDPRDDKRLEAPLVDKPAIKSQFEMSPTEVAEGKEQVEVSLQNQLAVRVATAGTLVLLQPPLTPVGVSIVQERGCQHFNSAGMSQVRDVPMSGRAARQVCDGGACRQASRCLLSCLKGIGHYLHTAVCSRWTATASPKPCGTWRHSGENGEETPLP